MAPRRTAPSGFPRFSEKIGRLRNSRYALRQPQPTAPDLFGKTRRCRGGIKNGLVGEARVLGVFPAGEDGLGTFGPLGPPPSSAAKPGDFCEDCLSAKREFRSSPVRRAAQGTPKGRWIGAAFFDYLSLAV